MRMDTDEQTSSRALVVIDEGISGEELRESLLRHIGDGVGSVFVVAPALADSGLKYVLGDVDDAIPAAEERLRETLAELREAGLEADGEVGDSDPIQAINDEIVKFGPDRIVIVAHRAEDSAFAERGLLEQAERDLDLPVTELVVDRAENPHVVGVERTKRGPARARGWRPSFNLPPLTRRDIAGILVAIVGTLLLGMLAAACVGDGGGGDHEEGRLEAECVVRILLALALALVNLAHVVGLFLFQSVGYDGIWTRFFARLSLFGTTTAVAISLAVGLLP
jgi:hypothetical protein